MLARLEDLEAAEVGLQRLRDPDRAVGLLSLLQDRDQGAPDRQPGAVQGGGEAARDDQADTERAGLPHGERNEAGRGSQVSPEPAFTAHGRGPGRGRGPREGHRRRHLIPLSGV